MLSLGLMSGTSMDGIDAALIKTDGLSHIEEIGHLSLSYDPAFTMLLKSAEHAVRQAEGDLTLARSHYTTSLETYLNRELALSDTTHMHQSLALYLLGNENVPIEFDQIIKHSTELHAYLVFELLKKTKHSAHDIHVIGYHGQTLYHNPAKKITLQLGDGKWLAHKTRIPVVNNFRRDDIEAGGLGAPLAPLYHQALARRDNKMPLAVVNCGGIANVTLITGSGDRDVIGFDTGPANGLIDRLVKQRTQGKEQMDLNGRYGLIGKVHAELLPLLYEKSIRSSDGNYFQLTPPKSLDIGDLQLIPELDKLSLEDACATLEAFTADSIVASTQFFTNTPPKEWILAGGGWNNPVILRELKHRLKAKLGNEVRILTADAAGWNSAALEAQIFAYLAVRSLLKLPISVPGTTRVPQAMTGGEFHEPTDHH